MKRSDVWWRFRALREWILEVREVKSEMKICFIHFEKWKVKCKRLTILPGPCESGYWKFEKWKVKWKSGSLISRMKSEMKMPWYRDWEWKVKWKCLKIEVESEKWIAFQVLKIKVFQQPAISTQTVNGFETLIFTYCLRKSPIFLFVSGCCINAAFVCLRWLSRLILPLIC